MIHAWILVCLFMQAQTAQPTVPPEVLTLLQSGVDAENRRDLDQAIAEFRQAAKLAPSAGVVFFRLGDAYMKKRDYASAIPPLKRAAELSPDSAPVHQLLGYALLTEGYVSEAIPHLTITHEYGALGIAQLQMGQPAEAVTNLQTAAAKSPDDPDLLYYLSRAGAEMSSQSLVSGWGMGLEDFDNDGWKDVFIAQSHVIDNVEKFDPGLRYLQPPLLALNHRGRFEQVDPGTNTPLAGRGAAFGDINNDGYVDVIMTVLGGAPQVFMNQASGNHWITVSLCGTRSNRDGLGARVEVNGQVRFATAAGSYLSSSDKRLHFGLGAATRANIEVLWPSGIRQQIAGAEIDQILKVQEPKQR